MNQSIEPPRLGRPPGCLTSPLSRWLRIEIQQAKRDNWTCPDAFYMLTEQNRKTPEKHTFIVGAETADEVWHQVFGDIKGRIVNYRYFRKLWKETQ